MSVPVIHYVIDDELHARAKAAAALCHMTLKEFLEQALDDEARKVEQRFTDRQLRQRQPEDDDGL